MLLAMSVVCFSEAARLNLTLTATRKAQAEMLWRTNGVFKMCQTESDLPLLGAEADGQTTKASED